ncbi:MAG: DUF2249 domain-containing protein [Candidatus Marinimicrobia bacterium]|nr:DUF2249 domain-containing protein [Candidatus Neomarinimicrobiota bacterium]
MSGCATGNFIHRKSITPDLTATDFLENYPELEAQLLEYAPDLKEIQGTDLFVTIANSVTLQHLADNLSKPVLEVVTELRSKASAVTGVAFDNEAGTPDWFKANLVKKSLDARTLLTAGGHPLSAVLEGLPELAQGEIFELVTPFLPEPLIERLRQDGYPAWSSCDEAGLFHNYFYNRRK